MASHTVYAVASGKGGVGKTATTVNLGASLAAAGYKVAIVDTDLGMANLGGFIGVEPDETLHEVLAGDASLEEATYRALNGLAVVPSGISLNGFANVETAVLSDAVGALREAFDYVLLDLGAGLSHDTVLPLALADAVVLVSTPRPVSIQDTAKTRQITERLGGRVAGVVLTRAGNPADLSLEEVSETLELPVLAVIPEDDAVPASAREGKAILQYDEDSPAVDGYHGLARIIEAESLEDAPVVPEMPDSGSVPATGSESDGTAEADAEPADVSGDAAEPAPSEASGTGAAADGATGRIPDAAPTEGSPAEGTDDAVATGDAETTAADIAAAIEDAASDPGGPADGEASAEGSSADAASGSTESPDAEPEPPSAAVPGSDAGAEAAGESTGAAPPDATGEAEAGEAADEAADAEEVEPEAFKVESSDEGESEEAEAVDRLFSVEGADPDELEDEEEESSGGLFGRFLG